MNHCSTHRRAITTSLAATLVSASFLALPLFAATALPTATGPSPAVYAEYIATKFKKVGADSGIFDNKTMENSAFDFAQYFRDPCFKPVGTTFDDCRTEFGPFYNLKDVFENGTLATILKAYPSLAGAANLIGTVAQEPTVQVRKLTENAILQLQIDSRARDVWAECVQKSATHFEASRCFQRNIRLTVNLPSVQVKGNVL